jgi:hypothetical protein
MPVPSEPTRSAVLGDRNPEQLEPRSLGENPLRGDATILPHTV